ncbi:hypothetical protein ARMSODRAFT_963182, partial [Armillaria solidipes]
SFATSLDPNDDLGTSCEMLVNRFTGPFWPLYTLENEVLLQLNGDSTTVIPDVHRKEVIEFLEITPTPFTGKALVGHR